MSAAVETRAASSVSGSLTLNLMRLRTFIALFAVLAFFSVAAPNFLSAANLVLMSKHVALNAFLAIGMTFVIITGGIDLSVGSIVGLCGMVAGGLILHGIDLRIGYTVFFNIPEIILIILALGVVIGLVNGLLITRLNVAPFIATLGHALRRARRRAAAVGRRDLPQSRGQSGAGHDGLCGPGGRAAFLPAGVDLDPGRGRARGRLSRALDAARAAHLRGRRQRARRGAVGHQASIGVKLFVYMFSGFCAAIVGLIISSELMAAHPATGETFELNAIAAAVLGGTSMSGGRGTIGGTVIGAFVIGILSDGLVMMGVSSFWQMVIKGVVIIAAVVIDQAQRKLQQRVADAADGSDGVSLDWPDGSRRD